MRGRRGLVTAARAVVAAVLAVVAAAVLALVPGVAAVPAVATNVVTAVGFSLVGALLVTRLPGNPVGWLLLVTGLGQAAGDAASLVAGLIGGSGDLAAWVSEWAWAPGVWGTVALLPQVFPSGPLPGRFWRAACWGSVTAVVVATLGYSASATDAASSAGVDVVVTAAETVIALAAVVGLVSLVVRWRRGAGMERQQLKWLLLATVALLLTYVVGDLLPPRVSDVVFVLVPLLLPAAVAVAVLRHGLYEIDVILNRALVYAALSLLVLAAYASGVALFGRASGLEAGPALVTVVAVALLFDPARTRLQRWVNRLTYGQRDEPLAVLRTVGRRVESAAVADQALHELAAALGTALRLPHVAVDVRLRGAAQEVARWGTPGGPEEEVPLTWGSSSVGCLRVTPRRPGEPLTRGDLRLVGDVARQAGAAAHALQLTEELRRSYERLAAVRHRERERLREDLHDGLGPLLAGVELGLGGVGRMLPPDDAVGDVVTRLREQVAAANGEVRRLIEELRPVVLDELGLVEALRRHAGQISADGDLEVEVAADRGIPDLPAELEVTAYRIAMEAITNVVRHSGAGRCQVSLTNDGATLRLEVTDDGHGMHDAEWGVGLTSMSRRAGLTGGCLQVGTGDGGGTSVRAELPLRQEVGA